MQSNTTAIALTTFNGEPRADSRVIAKQLGVEHKATYQLVRTYQADFERFSLVPFEMEAVKIAGGRGTKYQKYVLLNEDQSYLLLTYSQNTPQVRELKIRLVYTFGEYRRNVAQPAVKPALPDIPLVLIDGEPRIADLTLADNIGFPYPARIRQRIQRNRAKLAALGTLATAEIYGADGRQSTAYYLNRQQAIFMCGRADPTTVFDVQIEINQVFDACLSGDVMPVVKRLPLATIKKQPRCLPR